MEETKNSGAHSIIMAVCALAAIGAIVFGSIVILNHVNGGGSVSKNKEACQNKDGMDALNKAGVFSDADSGCEE